MSPHRRIPNVISIFDAYIRTTDAFLQEVIDPLPPVFTNWKRLGLTQEQADEWHGRRMRWEALYAKHRDVNAKTKVVNHEVKLFMKEFIAFGSPLLNVMASSFAVTPEDALIFRFKIGRAKRSRMVMPIAERCVPQLRSMGGGRVKIVCFPGLLTTPALPEGANAIMLAFKAGDAAPENPDECTKTIVISRSKFIYDVGVEKSYLQNLSKLHKNFRIRSG